MATELARISPSTSRRILGTGTLGALGTLLILLVFFRTPPTIPAVIMLLVLGFLALGLCVAFYRATVLGLVLTEQELVDTSGRLLTRIEDIHRVERGFLAFRPSNGFSLHLKTSQPRAWAPGLWWRFGRRIGVGGVISGAEGRAMADLIGALIARGKEGWPS